MEGDWILETRVEFRSYFWKQPSLHRYLPLDFKSSNQLTVTSTNDIKVSHKTRCIGSATKGVWQLISGKHVFMPSCQLFDVRRDDCPQLPKVIHAWGDFHLKRNILSMKKEMIMSSSSSPLEDNDVSFCDDTHYFYEDEEVSFLSSALVDKPVLLNNNTMAVYFGDMSHVKITEEAMLHHRWKLNILQIARRLPKPNVVIIGTGNEDLSSGQQNPIEFAKAFSSFLEFIVTEIYKNVSIIVKTTQYATHGSKGWNYGRSLAYSNIIRSTVASLVAQDKQVMLWDTHQIGFKENECQSKGFISNHNVLEIENNLLFQLLCW
ncbi:uncharacterized protein BX663DRAFT_199337 [Cokeromyces recurvatus]|uniref:uncharacterized protein n=1 Tax=Cokeromyces recurvatus TaxID=90255 RepID=UPI00221E4DB3|nr:uncharacterized protein BX663DRAFT_199337 [Cokeromyces recurvatus]KAI7906614.1 hypothetical protein BX663DRAFT_199337 [Cokeromyces recurvatus]